MGNARSVPPAQDACWILILLGCPPDEHPRYASLGSLVGTAGGDMRLTPNVIWLAFGGLWTAASNPPASPIRFVPVAA